ncbi:peptidoglycan-binding domain-containing protein [Paracoccus rhizosphaerae]|uniref:Peptidoglycan-binding protein n=2 Tax=Paracoccus rhizosphaerae TaxID=1133347 RepID=A0ABV6CEB5_9RHOB
MRRLMEAQRVFFRIEDGGQRYDASFDLAGIQPVVEAVAGACGFILLQRTRNDYRAIQTMLNAAGFDTGAPDGVWGSGSARAMREWQEKNGLPATSAPDRISLEAMGITLAAE